MSITPIDVKTNIAGNNDASRIRENQKNQELGSTQLVAQNTEKEQVKFETVHNSEATEGKVIRQEDQEAEREKPQPDIKKKARKPKPEEEEEKDSPPTLPDPQGVRGLKIDVKA